MKIILETKRTYLRELTNSDAAILTERIFGDASVMKFSKRGVEDIEYTKTYVTERSINELYANNLGYYGIVLKETDEIIGVGILSELAFASGKEIEIGCRLARKYWGKGIAPEIEKEMTAYFFKTHPDKDYLIAAIGLTHKSSIRTAERCGFSHLRDDIFPGTDIPVKILSKNRGE